MLLPTRTRLVIASRALKHAGCPYRAPIKLSSISAAPPPNRESPQAPSSHRGNVPFHETFAIVHTDIPPTDWPSNIQPIIPLYPELQAYARNFHGIVSIAYFPRTGSPAPLKTPQPTPPLSSYSIHDSTRPTGSPARSKPQERSHRVTMFADGNKVIEFSRVRLQDAEHVYRDLYGGLLDQVPVSGLGASVKTPNNNYGVSHIFVCTHAARGCRCGTTGVDVFNAISKAVAEHPDWGTLGVQVGKVAHVGGHKWAANILVYPRGDWYRHVKVENIPGLLKDIMRKDWGDHASSNCHWAGRMGMSSVEQKARIQTDFTALTKPSF